jgi:hypothetical protein
MKVIIFAGPTISAEEVRALLDADVRPPAAQGDVYRAAVERPGIIGIIDGYFERVPSVSHKEVLWAMKEGTHVLGAASIGALRAAELAQFGMEGVGDVFEAFRRGELDADDEVAVAHASAEGGYRALSVAMVDIRATLAAMAEQGVIGDRTCGKLIDIARTLFYADRIYPALIVRGREAGLPEQELDRLRGGLLSGRVERKKQDAIALLRTIRGRIEAGLCPKEVRYHFQHTDAWDFIADKAHPAGG